MKKLHVNLDDEAEAAWNSVLSHPKFRRMNQQGVIEHLCTTFLRENVPETGGNKSCPTEDGWEPADDYLLDKPEDFKPAKSVDPITIPGTPEYEAELNRLLS